MKESDSHKERAHWIELSPTRAWWLVVSAIAIAIIVGLGTLDLIRLIAVPLAVFTFGLTLAAALEPIVAWLGRWMPRLVSMILVYFLLLVLLGGLLWLVVPSLVNQVQDFAAYIPDLADQVVQFFNRLRGNTPSDSFINTLISQFSNLGPTLLSLPITITSAFAGSILILFLSFYMLLEAGDIRGFILSLFPEESRAQASDLLIAMTQSMGGYVRGTVINGVIVGFLTFLGLQFLGINFALTFGVMAGTLELIPVAGPIISGFTIVLLTLLQSPLKALYALIFMIVLQQTENHILVPNIMSNQTKVSPLLSIIALFTGGAIGGLLGALIAIPISAALRVLVIRVIAPAIRRRTHVEQVGDDSE